jgi:hypothetical protein
MKYLKEICLVLALLVMSATAHALPYKATGNDWHVSCAVGTSPSGDCLLYLLDVYGEQYRLFCVPNDVAFLQIVDVFTRYVDAHPETRQRPIPELLNRALSEVWKCGAK